MIAAASSARGGVALDFAVRGPRLGAHVPTPSARNEEHAHFLSREYYARLLVLLVPPLVLFESWS